MKIGGSLFSDKRVEHTIDHVALRAYARALAKLVTLAPGEVAFVSGGGSLGHGAVRTLDPLDPHAALPLTEAVFKLKWHWTLALRACGVRAMPLQLAAVCTVENGSVQVQDVVLRRLLAAGVLPVLSGDVLIAEDGSLQVFGSDRVPEALLGVAQGPTRIVSLTDVPGILVGREGRRTVLRDVDPDDPAAALDAIWATPAWDTSDAMAGKLDALLMCARRDAECFILNGELGDHGLSFLLDQPEHWPVGYTRISRRGGAAGTARCREREYGCRQGT